MVKKEQIGKIKKLSAYYVEKVQNLSSKLLVSIDISTNN